MCTRCACLIVDYYQHIFFITFDSSRIKMILFDVYASRINSILNIYNDNTMYVCFYDHKNIFIRMMFFEKSIIYVKVLHIY